MTKAGAVLRRFYRSMRKRYLYFFPQQTAVRSAIKYELDCRELIDLSIYLYDEWEPDTRSFIDSYVKTNFTVLEVGANIGAHTLLLAQAVGPEGRIFAIEPTVYARTKLLRNIELNPNLRDRITVLDYLVTDESKYEQRRSLKSSWRMDDIDDETSNELVTSKAATLDELDREYGMGNVDVLKIDIDGYDYKALLGATELITRARPVVIMELAEWALAQCGDSVRSILDYFHERGYSAWNADGMSRISEEDVQKMLAGKLWMNGVFLPES